MANTTSVEINFVGQKIALKSYGEPDLVEEIVKLAEQKLGEAETRVATAVPPHQIALLALLDMAEEYVNAKRKAKQQQVDFSNKSRKLLDLIENTLSKSKSH